MERTQTEFALRITDGRLATDGLEHLFSALERSWTRHEPLPDGLEIVGCRWTAARVVHRGTAQIVGAGELQIIYAIAGIAEPVARAAPKVWVVWQETGEYSAYSATIVAVFSTETLADEYIRQQEEGQKARKAAAAAAGRGFHESWWTSFEMSVDELAVMAAHGTPHEET